MNYSQSIPNGQSQEYEDTSGCEISIQKTDEHCTVNSFQEKREIDTSEDCTAKPTGNNGQCVSFDALISDLNNILEDTEGGPVENFPSSDNMTKFYAKFSQQCSEIERLEKMVQKLQNQLKSANHENEACANQMKDLNRHHTSKVAELERRLVDIDIQCKTNRERFNAQEDLIRKNYADKEAKLAVQIEQLKKSSETARKERDIAVIKYAQREKEMLTLESSEKKLRQQWQQVSTEKDALNARLRGAKNEKEQLLQVLAQKENEASDWKRKCEDLRNLLNEHEIKMKMAEKRVENMDKAHTETRFELEKVMKKLNESKEENATLKTSYEQMIQKIQQKESDSNADPQETVDYESVSATADQLGIFKEENEKLKSQLYELQSKLSDKIAEIDVLNNSLETKENENRTLQRSLHDFCTLSDEHLELTRLYEDSQRHLVELEQQNADLELESASFRLNAENMLELTHKLTDKNSHLHSENISLTSRLETIEREKSELDLICQDVKSHLALLTNEAETSSSLYRSEIGDLKEKILAASQNVESLNTLLEDERNQNRILKKKYAAAVKELKGEISLLKRRLDAYEAGTASQCSAGSFIDEHREASSNSRSPSMTSLDVPTNLHTQSRHQTSCGGTESPHIDSSCADFHASNHDVNQAMIEKIVKLQRMLARRSEKIEFLEEHVKQMISELQKKSRIIQIYALRDQTTGLASASVDLNKAQFAQKGNTIMGRVFGGNSLARLDHQVNDMGQLSPELSVQIMSKLQTLFEDTMLKNITLKENIQTLGEEIAALSRENRTLKLQPNHT